MTNYVIFGAYFLEEDFKGITSNTFFRLSVLTFEFETVRSAPALLQQTVHVVLQQPVVVYDLVQVHVVVLGGVSPRFRDFGRADGAEREPQEERGPHHLQKKRTLRYATKNPLFYTSFSKIAPNFRNGLDCTDQATSAICGTEGYSPRNGVVIALFGSVDGK